MLLSLIYSMFIHLFHHLFHVVKCDSVGALQNKAQLIPHLDNSLYAILIQVLFDLLGPSREETDDTSGNTIDLSTVNSSPSIARAINSSPNMGKTVDLPLTILSAPPHQLQHQQVLL